MGKYQDKEFYSIISPILEIDEFQKLGNIEHHGITRLDHSLRVAYYTYVVTKKLHLNYKKATEAALLHDFFSDEVENENGLFKLRRHPNCAVWNAKKYFELDELQEDIIKCHMFPITFTPPKYLESWIVDIVDDVAAIYEKSYSTHKQLSAASLFLFVVLSNILRIR